MERTCHVATLLCLIYSPIKRPQVRLQIELPQFPIRKKIDSSNLLLFLASFSLLTPCFLPRCFPAGTPINRIPIMAKQILDLYMLYKLVTEKGGLVEIINKKIWREITKGLNLPTSITSAAFTLRTQ